MSQKNSISGKTVLITGAGSGVGEATALLFAAEGARVIAVGRTVSKLESVAAKWNGGEKIAVYGADVANPEEVSNLSSRVSQEIGPVDVVVSCAGINIAKRGVFDTSDEDFDRVFAINTRGPFNLLRSFAPKMKERASGTVVIVSSIAGYSLPSSVAGVAYSASKSAVLTIAAMAREELRGYGVNISAYCPGVVNTPILDDRPVPPPAEQRARFLQAHDCAEDLLHICTRPPRGNIVNMVSVPVSQSYSCDMSVTPL